MRRAWCLPCSAPTRSAEGPRPARGTAGGLRLILLNPLQSAEALPPERFVRATAAWIEGATEQSATWDVSAVLSTVADMAGEDLAGQILLQLPVGYDLLFGHPQPI